MNNVDLAFENLEDWIEFLVDCIDNASEEGSVKLNVMTPEDDYIDGVDEMISHKVFLRIKYIFFLCGSLLFLSFLHHM